MGKRKAKRKEKRKRGVEKEEMGKDKGSGELGIGKR